MFGFGLAGLLLYLLLPVVQSHSDIFPVRFWTALKANLGNQVGIIGKLYRSERSTVALLGLTSLVPIFIIGIKWASHFGDTSKIGAALATFMLHAIHGLFLVACIWVSLDPPFSPRHIGFGQHFLTFYYLGALSVGYLIGYFLLVFGAKPARARRLPQYITLTNTIVKFATWFLFLVAPAWLVFRNLPQIRTTNGPMFQQMANYFAESLPATGGVVLSDDPRRRLLAQAAVTRNGKDKSFVFVDSGSVGEHLALEYPDYHRYLRKRHGATWPGDPPKTLKAFINSAAMIPLFSVLERSNTIVYLHPSFGAYFERFYLEPHGLTYQFISYKSTNAVAPPLTQETVAQNEAFWSKAQSEAIAPILSATSLPQRRAKTLMEIVAQKTHLQNEPNGDAIVLANFYSRALDYWGVEMQKRGELEKAASHFEMALQLSSNNVAARVNLECNENLRNHRPTAVRLTKSVTDSFGPFRTWNTVIGENGPFDEPNFCFEQGQMFVQNKLFRQALHQFARAKDLDPSHLQARLWLAQLYAMIQRPDDALQLIQEVHENEALFQIGRTNANELMFAEASAHLAKNDIQRAEAVIQKTIAKYQSDKELLPVLLSSAAQTFLNYKYYSNAVEMIDRHLVIAPDNVPALVNKGYVLLQMTNYAQAISPLTRALELTNNNAALLNRAIAYLRAGQLDESQQDYLRLQQEAPKAFAVYYGLGEIAYRRKDTNSAIQFYQSYLTNVVNGSPNAEEIKFVSQRLTELKQQ
jgi:tetratricopeptide (TPR) repeat protein